MLYNLYSKPELVQRLNNEKFNRCTLSFYRYVDIKEPDAFRNFLFVKLNDLDCLGRIYVAREGINAQLSVPEFNTENLLDFLDEVNELKQVPVKWAIENDNKSFYKLIIKVKPKIVADGLEDGSFDTANAGNHLTALEFHNYVGKEDVVVVDMRNNYESEVGFFENAIRPDVVTFREGIQVATQKLDEHRDKKILLYCTGGIRCEKASAYLKHKGFTDVNQLYGGIIEYVQQIKALNISTKFIGKNFVFDNRLGERVTSDIVSVCHQCGAVCDNHTNCSNDHCHMLFIQCDECKIRYNNCCCESCANELADPQYKVRTRFKGKKWRRLSGEIVYVI